MPKKKDFVSINTVPSRRVQVSAGRYNQQPLSPRKYIAISSAILLFAAVLLGGFIYLIPRLARFGISGNVFYVILVLLGLGSAAFVFGAMRSYAHYTGTGVSQGLELGGPVVGAVLVVVGGLYAIPRLEGPDVFSVTVRAVGPDNKVLNSGSITLLLGDDTREAPIARNGEANFKGIPARFRNQEVTIRADIEHYKLRDDRVPLTSPLNLQFDEAVQVLTPSLPPERKPEITEPRRRIAKPDPKVTHMINDAKQEYSRTNYCAALAKCKTALKLDSGNTEALVLKSNIEQTISTLHISCPDG